ncbi:MAG: hypothetical protein ACRBDI_03220 [Alphaproteobacteria bacterium]
MKQRYKAEFSTSRFAPVAIGALIKDIQKVTTRAFTGGQGEKDKAERN